MSKWQTKYPELGGVDKQKKFYGEGEEYVHPSGVKYIRRNGNWVIKGGERDVAVDGVDGVDVVGDKKTFS